MFIFGNYGAHKFMLPNRHEALHQIKQFFKRARGNNEEEMSEHIVFLLEQGDVRTIDLLLENNEIPSFHRLIQTIHSLNGVSESAGDKGSVLVNNRLLSQHTALTAAGNSLDKSEKLCLTSRQTSGLNEISVKNNHDCQKLHIRENQGKLVEGVQNTTLVIFPANDKVKKTLEVEGNNGQRGTKMVPNMTDRAPGQCSSITPIRLDGLNVEGIELKGAIVSRKHDQKFPSQEIESSNNHMMEISRHDKLSEVPALASKSDQHEQEQESKTDYFDDRIRSDVSVASANSSVPAQIQRGIDEANGEGPTDQESKIFQDNKSNTKSLEESVLKDVQHSSGERLQERNQPMVDSDLDMESSPESVISSIIQEKTKLNCEASSTELEDTGDSIEDPTSKTLIDHTNSLYVNMTVPETVFPPPNQGHQHGPALNLGGFLSSAMAKNQDSNREETVESKMEEIFTALNSNQIILIQGNTGCGKTTKIPKYLLREYKNIIVTQPRRIAAISVAKKVATDMGCKVGSEVGFSVRFNDCYSKQTLLKYATDGILLREINRDKNLSQYNMVIVDEAHERTVNIDIILAYLKRITTYRKDLKVIIMSATLSAEKFVNFFDCPLIEIKHKVFPLENYFLKVQPQHDYLIETSKTAVQIYRTEPVGDILVFLTGQDEIKKAEAIITGELREEEVLILLIYSTLSPEQQELVFRPSTKRKIILATNIAETSITIENIRYVVDCGRAKQLRFSPVFGMDILEVVWISKAEAKQRSGRAGRTGPGKVFRIYTKKEYENMADNRTPEIISVNLSNTIILLKSIGINDITNFDLIDSPKYENVVKALELLYYLKIIDANGLITKLGRRVANIPLVPELSVALIAAERLGCLEDVAIIAGMLTVEHIWKDIPRNSDEFSLQKEVL